MYQKPFTLYLYTLQAYPFTIEVYVETDGDHSLNSLPSLLNSKSKTLQAALKEAYTNKGVRLLDLNFCICIAARHNKVQRR